MARMIPSAINPDTDSAAERKLFRQFQLMPDTEHWTILHSVGIARHRTQAEGESDFVVIIPNEGIFVLEVKGGRIGYGEKGWTSTDMQNVIHSIKDPVNEARQGMYSLMDYIKEHDEKSMQLSYCLFGYGVVFPDTNMRGRFSLPDIDDLQIADADDFYNMKNYLLRLAGYTKSRRSSTGIAAPDKIKADAIIQMLRPTADIGLSLSGQIRTVERKLIEFTENQQQTFNGLAENERCLIKGSAGTGKTVLAINHANRLIEQGKRVAVFCYNIRLAEHLRDNIFLNEKNVLCCSFTEYMEQIAWPCMSKEVQKQKETDRNRYYRELLPHAFENTFIDLNMEPYDVLIVDEAQDLLDENFLMAADLLLKDGLANGCWYFFMDAERQNLYHSKLTPDDANRLLAAANASYFKYTLYDNCRNSEAIIEMTDRLFGTKTKHRMFADRGPEVCLCAYRKTKNEAEKLQELIAGVLEGGVDIDDIVILSTAKFDHSVAAQLEDYEITEDHHQRNGKLLFSTVHAFKGLESSVVILTDIEGLDYDLQKNLLYIGMTRARNALFILASNDAKVVMDEMIRSHGKQ